jgi:endogenous inhibitor of DNA gyrase (YacG/DUF329 family)
MKPTNPNVVRYLSIRPVVGGRRLYKKRQLSCPACGKPVTLEVVPNDFRLRCPTCQAALAIGLKHEWLYAPICFTGGLIIAYAQDLQNPLFLMCTLIYSGIITVVAAPILGPLFPLELQLARDYIQTLRIPK